MAKAKKAVYAEGAYQEADGTAKYYLVDAAGTKIYFDSYEAMKAYNPDPNKDPEVAQKEADIQSQIDALNAQQAAIKAQE